ncbi:MAG: aminomethyl-transferring glycine dehydrogenase subunit GcvPA [Candidatus Bathyarchaeota archaeon]|nr:aminomethyl-transferring glycine dehydrogenase subunit GcvPA [Candidatus Bathyarchaeota archaeon]
MHPYLPNSVPEIKEKMMKDIGIKTIADLYSDIPDELIFRGTLDIPGPHTEAEVKQHVSGLLEENTSLLCPPFMGGGVWPHYVPSVVDEVVHRAEFLTSYTPYQPEISQGILQAIFEYQSLVSELVAMDVTNSSLYDWATAVGEVALMCSRITRKTKFLVPDQMSPYRLSVLKTYTKPANITIQKVGHDEKTGQMDLEDLKSKIDDSTSAVYIETPSYLGFVEENAEAIGEIAHDHKKLFTVGVDPTSLGVLKAPGDYGADIVCGEGQPLGNHMNYGGPLLGILSCRHDNRFLRQMPGRIIGITEALKDRRRAYVMTLATREQHIRREKATSNICSNQALLAVASGVYLSLMGPQGMKELGETITSRSQYAQKKINELPGVKAPVYEGFHFKEFPVNFQYKTLKEVHYWLTANNIEAGIPLNMDFPEMGESSLFCVTEVHSKEHIDTLVSVLKEALEG